MSKNHQASFSKHKQHTKVNTQIYVLHINNYIQDIGDSLDFTRLSGSCLFVLMGNAAYKNLCLVDIRHTQIHTHTQPQKRKHTDAIFSHDA